MINMLRIQVTKLEKENKISLQMQTSKKLQKTSKINKAESFFKFKTNEINTYLTRLTKVITKKTQRLLGMKMKT